MDVVLVRPPTRTSTNRMPLDGNNCTCTRRFDSFLEAAVASVGRLAGQLLMTPTRCYVRCHDVLQVTAWRERGREPVAATARCFSGQERGRGDETSLADWVG